MARIIASIRLIEQLSPIYQRLGRRGCREWSCTYTFSKMNRLIWQYVSHWVELYPITIALCWTSHTCYMCWTLVFPLLDTFRKLSLPLIQLFSLLWRGSLRVQKGAPTSSRIILILGSRLNLSYSQKVITQRHSHVELSRNNPCQRCYVMCIVTTP